MLLILGQPERTVMSLMGWSSTGMTTRYQHLTDGIRTEVAAQVGDLIWEARSDGGGEETVVVRRDSLAVILPLVEEGLSRGSENVGLDDLQGSIADLRAALAARAGGASGDRK